MDPTFDPGYQHSAGRLRAAIDLVFDDVTAYLGAGAVGAFIAGEDEMLALESLISTNPELVASITSPTQGSSTSEAWIFVPGEAGATGVAPSRFACFADLVVNVAEIAQERVMESALYFGAAVPPCPEHPNTPLWPTVRDGYAVWACIDGGATAHPVGTMTGV